MASLTEERSTLHREGDIVNLPVAAGVVIYAGALVAVDGDGNAVPGAAGTRAGVGRAITTVDNRDGVAGEKRVDIYKGIFAYEDSDPGNPLTTADIGKPCFLIDDQSVTKTDNGSTAGIVFDVDTCGVWIDMR